MYNGIGLQTPRGSGTNGFVQRNLALVRQFKGKVDYRTEEDLQKLEAMVSRGPNIEIREHARKRALELKCVEMEDIMRDQGYGDDEVDEQVTSFRKMLMERELTAPPTSHIPTDQWGKPTVRETHAIAEAQHEKNKRLKEAFGISEYFVEGSSLDPNRLAKEEAARAVQLQQQQQQKETAEAPKKYGLVRTPSPEAAQKKDKKEKKKKKKRSRDRSSSRDSRKKHKSKKSKRSR